MEENWQVRTQLLFGERAERLNRAHVLVVGLGGVGAYVAEMLCRSGVGELTLVDADVVNASNLNRQLVALTSTLGEPKSDVLGARLKDINPQIKLNLVREFIRDQRTDELLDAATYDFVVDAIDTLSPKVFLIYSAMQRDIPLVSSMGAGGKTDPTLVKLSDISKSHNCRLAKVVRKRLYKLGVRKGFSVVYSSELVPDEVVELSENEQNKKSTVGTVSYMPAIFGCFLASHVIRALTAPSEPVSE